MFEDTNRMEYEANVFAAEFMLSDDAMIIRWMLSGKSLLITISLHREETRKKPLQERGLFPIGRSITWISKYLQISYGSSVWYFFFNRLTSCLIVIVSNPLTSLQKVVFYDTAWQYHKGCPKIRTLRIFLLTFCSLYGWTSRWLAAY